MDAIDAPHERKRAKKFTLAFAIAILLSAAPLPTFAQLYVGISAPPLLPLSIEQPPLTVPNEIWQPGYWAYGPNGYYWVPGTWVQPPAPGLLYTPSYWSAADNGYTFNQGYWAPQVGYYGGINYGAGYYGNGYVGGAWAGPNFTYNTAVSAVNPTIIRRVYVNRTVIVRRVNYYSFNGPHGVLVRPTPAQVVVMRERHVPITVVQREHITIAEQDRNLLHSVNNGRPQVVAVARPLNPANRPPDFRPVTNGDRQGNNRPEQPAAAEQSHPQQPAHQPAKTEPKPAAHPAAKPAPHPAAKPPSHPVAAKPPSHPAAKPPSHPESKPASHPAPKPASHPAAKPASHPESKPASHPESKPASHPEAKPASHPDSHANSHGGH